MGGAKRKWRTGYLSNFRGQTVGDLRVALSLPANASELSAESPHCRTRHIVEWVAEPHADSRSGSDGGEKARANSTLNSSSSRTNTSTNGTSSANNADGDVSPGGVYWSDDLWETDGVDLTEESDESDGGHTADHTDAGADGADGAARSEGQHRGAGGGSSTPYGTPSAPAGLDETKTGDSMGSMPSKVAGVRVKQRLVANAIALLEVKANAYMTMIPGMDLVLKPVVFEVVEPATNSVMNRLGPDIEDTLNENLAHGINLQVRSSREGEV